jgi:GR25 family glycosyltransferase involved in LPS biosynthesis
MLTIDELFDHVYIISVDPAHPGLAPAVRDVVQARRQLMAAHMASVRATKWSFFDATVATDVLREDEPARALLHPAWKGIWHVTDSGWDAEHCGHIGCSISHWRAQQAVVSAGHARALILEDDLQRFDDDLLALMNLRTEVEGVADVIRYAVSNPASLTRPCSTHFYFTEHMTNGAMCYEVNQAGAAYLLALNTPIHRNADSWWVSPRSVAAKSFLVGEAGRSVRLALRPLTMPEPEPEPEPERAPRAAFGGIDRFVYINLDARVDRRAQVEAELDKLGVRDMAVRFAAVAHPIGQYGCACSHAAVLRAARDDPSVQRLCVLEDDFQLVVSPKALRDAVDSFVASRGDGEFDVLFLACFVKAHTSRVALGGGVTAIKVAHGQTTAGYIINRRAFDAVLSVWENHLGPLLDARGTAGYCLDITWVPLQAPGEWYALEPRVAKQRASFSDITGRVENYGV